MNETKELDKVCMQRYESVVNELNIAKRMRKKVKDERMKRYLNGKIYGLTFAKNSLWRIHVSISFMAQNQEKDDR